MISEKTMQSIFGRHLRKNPPPTAEVYELKISKKNSIPFDAVQPHQIEALQAAQTGGYYFKIPDQPVSWGASTQMRFAAKKPFDCFMIVNTPAFVVLWFYKLRQPKVFIKIPIRTFLAEKAISERKSLTETRALEIGESISIARGES